MKFVIRIVPMIVVMGTIFFLSHQSGDSLDLPSFFGADKLAHMIAYGGLAFTVLWFFGEKGLENPWRTSFMTVLFCLLYGISDEYHQSFIDLRSVSIFDLLADTAGAFCCSLLWAVSPALQQKMLACQINLLKCTQFK
ncbi:MAG: VanZ family protein [Desulfocapsa sp.]|nr:VanZ family protein [Desulfocapsa sp.]